MGIFEFDDEKTKPHAETKQWKGILDFDDHLMFGYLYIFIDTNVNTFKAI